MLRVATYNIEWFDTLFAQDGSLLCDDQASGRGDVTRAEQLEALGIVFNALDADAVMIVEAPDTDSRRDTIRALTQFADWAGLRTTQAVMGYVNETQQEIALLYDPLVLSAHHDPIGAPADLGTGFEAPAFNSVYFWDIDTDRSRDPIRFSKPPLELSVKVLATGFEFRMIGVHIKSKAPHGARSDADAMRISIENRRKQLAQCIWLRERVEGHLRANEPLIVLGDFNDGPGLDDYEKLFGRSGIEIVMGEGDSDAEGDPTPRLFDPHAHAALVQHVGPALASARFYIEKERRYLSALLDYVMVSQDLAPKAKWRIWHPFNDQTCYETPELRDALLNASDHFPVSVDMNLEGLG